MMEPVQPYEPPPVRHTGRTIALIFIVALALGYGGYYAYSQYLEISAGITADQLRTQQIQQTNAALTAALSGAGVDPLQISRGFWYTYRDAAGNESVAYFDINQMSLQDLTKDQIAAIAAQIASSTVVDRTLMREVPESELPSNLQFHNELYQTPVQAPGTFQNKQAQLEKLFESGQATADQLWQLSYMYELQGDYGKRDAVNAADCKLYKARCAGTIAITLSGTVIDGRGEPIQGASVSVLSHPEVRAATTDVSGTYAIKLSVLPMEKVRVSAQKRNYSNGVASAIVLDGGKSAYRLDPITIATPISIVTLDTQKRTVTDPRDRANPDGSFVLYATSSTYEIPPGAIVDATNKPYVGQLDVYIYEFTRETVPSSLTTLDTFDSVMGYAGNLMQTLGMPYIQFFTPQGAELDVLKSKPMLLTYKISGMQDILDNFYKRPEGPLTQAQLQTILDASSGDPGFPITSQFLYDRKISTFPAFWVFDQRRGVWENQGMRLLDSTGTMQAPFYTTDDQT